MGACNHTAAQRHASSRSDYGLNSDCAVYFVRTLWIGLWRRAQGGRRRTESAGELRRIGVLPSLAGVAEKVAAARIAEHGDIFGARRRHAVIAQRPRRHQE